MQRPRTFSIDQLLAHQAWMRRLARALAGEDADDLVQDGWLAAMARPPAADGPAEPWLATVLRRLAGKRALAETRRGRREAREIRESGEGTAAATPEELVADAEAGRRLTDWVEALPEPLRQVVHLRYYEGRSAVEVARALGLPAATVRWRTKRALDELRLRLDDRKGRRLRRLLLLGHWWRPGSGRGLAPGLRWPGITVAVAVGAAALVVAWHAVQRPAASFGRAPSAGAPAVEGRKAGSRLAAANRPLDRALVPRFLWSPPAPSRSVGGVLQGHVRDAAGVAVPGATVQGHRQSTEGSDGDGDGAGAGSLRLLAPVTTGPDGSFRFEGLASGLYNLFASADGLAVGSRVSLEVHSGDGARPPTTVELRLAREGAVLSGRVLDAVAGVIPGAKIEVRGVSRLDGSPAPVVPAAVAFTLASDQEGRFRVRLPRLGYRVKASADGYGSAQKVVELGADLDQELTLSPSRPLTGRVTTAGPAPQVPVDGAEVFAIPLHAFPSRRQDDWAIPRFERTATRGDGRFVFAGLPPGAYQLVARRFDLVGEAASPVEVTDLLEAAPVELALTPGLTVEGTVLRDGRPVARARVRLLARGRRRAGTPLDHPVALTDEDGRFALPRVLPGDYRLQALDDDWALRFDQPLSLRRSHAVQIALDGP